MLEPERKIRTTICTPTYQMMRRNPKTSKMLGWMLFFIFMASISLLMLGVAAVIFGSYPQTQRTVMLSVFVAAIFLVLISMFMVDVHSSIDESIGAVEDNTKKLEARVYELQTLMTKYIKDNKKP